MARRTSQPWYGRDWGLSVRMGVTLLLLLALYAIFAGVLWEDLSHWLLGVILVFAAGSQLLFSDRLMFWISGARIVSAEQAPELHHIVSRLAQLADLPMPTIAVVQTRTPNAFAMGKRVNRSTVVVTTGLIASLQAEELEAVLAHELTHIKNRDVTVLAYASFFSLIAAWIVQNFFWFGGAGSRGNRRSNVSGGQYMIIVWGVSVAVWAVSFILIRTLSRQREYTADRGSAILTGHPAHLVSALQKIQTGTRRTPTQDLRDMEGVSAFCIFPVKKTVTELVSTHPSIEHRIQRLSLMQQTMEH